MKDNVGCINKEKDMMTNKDLWNWSSDADEIQDMLLHILNDRLTVEQARNIITRKEKQDDND
jgi:hypothetical protein